MKKGSFLLNASRGNVVNIADLVTALKSGHLGGACKQRRKKEEERKKKKEKEKNDTAKRTFQRNKKN